MKDLQKRVPIRSKAIRAAAKDEPCCICGRNDGTTVFCHLDEGWAGKGMGQKADDIAGFFGCSICHYEYGQKWTKLAKSHETIMRAMYQTLRRLWDRGIIGELK